VDVVSNPSHERVGGIVHPDVTALVALQVEDAEIYQLEARLASLEPRMAKLERQRQVAAEALARARTATEAEERSHRDLAGKLAIHRQLEARNQSQLEHISKAKEAGAAMAQLEQSRRLAADVEGMMQNVQVRMAEHRERFLQQEQALAAIEREQEQARGEIAAERVTLEEQLRHARQKREGVASRVGRSLLAKYDKIRGRKGAHAVFALRDGACGNCDTAIPLQRRNVMLTSGSIEMCEGCGVLLYAEN
jgi:uncharacterized protein